MSFLGIAILAAALGNEKIILESATHWQLVDRSTNQVRRVRLHGLQLSTKPRFQKLALKRMRELIAMYEGLGFSYRVKKVDPDGREAVLVTWDVWSGTSESREMNTFSLGFEAVEEGLLKISPIDAKPPFLALERTARNKGLGMWFKPRAYRVD